MELQENVSKPACVWERKAHDAISPTPPHSPQNVQKTTKTQGRLRAVGQLHRDAVPANGPWIYVPMVIRAPYPNSHEVYCHSQIYLDKQ